jgi:predicted DsbA family dithiol-disulfide isomerase
MKERLLKAYFIDGEHVGKSENLAKLASEIGLDEADVLRSLTEEEYLPAVKADMAQAQAYGINGVPFYVIDGKYGISGAQDSATFAAALTEAAENRD